MKTLSQLIRSLLSIRRDARIDQNLKNSLNNETESSPTAEAAEMAASAPAETSADTPQPEEQEPKEEPGLNHPEPEVSRQAESVPEQPEQEQPEEPLQGESGQKDSLAESPEEAYRRGLEEGMIEGRNQKIEETYFPKDDDGIPAFHGSPRSSRPASIFSMAREA